MRLWKITLLGVIVASLVRVPAAQAQTVFTPGNLITLQADSVTTNTTIHLLELSPTVAGQTSPINSFAVPTTGPNALFTSGSATSNGYLRNSPDGSLNFTGHTNNGGGTVNINTITARAVGRYTFDGNFAVVAPYTGSSGNQTRSAVTADGVNYYIGDQNGVYLNGGTAPALGATVRGMQILGGQSYITQNSTTAILASALNPALPPTSGSVTATPLPGLTASSTLQDAYFLATGTQGANPDLLYVATTSGISKFSFDGSTWTARGNAAIAGGEFGLAASVAGGGVNLYYTSGSGATAANNVATVFDASAFNANINLGSPTVLFTAPAGTTLKGIAFSPVPEPTAILAICGAGFGAAMWVRRRFRKPSAPANATA
jgi:trimeric autotransporter adhesin